jgi:hypothetical protein
MLFLHLASAHRCLQAGFAQLASANPYMHRVIARAGVPVAVFAPTNAALAAYLRDAMPLQNPNGTGNDDSSSSSLSRLLGAAAAQPGSTILLLLRHSK